jgi:hypothetical protein
MPAHETLNDGQFEHHVNAFKQQTGVELLGTHAIVGDRVVPTVRQNLVTKQKNGKASYMLEASIPGEEGNLHSLTVHTFGDKPFYGLALSSNARKENLDTNDLAEFSTKMGTHLSKAVNTPPSTKQRSELSGLGMDTSDTGIVAGHLDEWHRKGKLSATEVNDFDAKKTETRVYDPVSEKHISGATPIRKK